MRPSGRSRQAPATYLDACGVTAPGAAHPRLRTPKEKFVSRLATLLPVACAAFAAGAISVCAIPASASLFGGDKGEAKQEGGKPAATPAPTLKETMSAVGEIA